MKSEKKQLHIVIDFDGTVCAHEYPEIGSDIGAVPILKKLIDSGHKLILFTMRDNKGDDERQHLDEAVQWFHERDIELYGIQTNPTQNFWTSSPKAYGHIIIDDASLGCPLVYPENGDRPYVDWNEIDKLLHARGAFL